MQCPNCAINIDENKRKCKCGYDYESGLIDKEEDQIDIKVKPETNIFEYLMILFGIAVVIIISKYIRPNNIESSMCLFASVGAISGFIVGIIFNGKDPMRISTGYAAGVIYYLYYYSNEISMNEIIFGIVLMCLMFVGAISAAAACLGEKAYIYVKNMKA